MISKVGIPHFELLKTLAECFCASFPVSAGYLLWINTRSGTRWKAPSSNLQFAQISAGLLIRA
jgi:hypothetical protein